MFTQTEQINSFTQTEQSNSSYGDQRQVRVRYLMLNEDEKYLEFLHFNRIE